MDSGKTLESQVAIVTGGGRGIGRTIARCLAEAGAAVVVAGRSVRHLTETVQLIEQAGGQAFALGTDVTDRQAVEALAHTTQERYGSVDLLVNNAAQLTIAPIWEADPDEWWQCVTVNLRGTFLCTRAILPGMIARGRGRIFNVISSQAYRDQPYLSAYSTSKTGLIRFTGSLAAETKAHGLSAFAIYPGQVDTPMQEYVAQVPSPEWRRWRDSGPAPRFIPPERVGRLVEALASGKADALSGRVISVNDDLDELILRAEEIVEHDLLSLRLQTQGRNSRISLIQRQADRDGPSPRTADGNTSVAGDATRGARHPQPVPDSSPEVGQAARTGSRSKPSCRALGLHAL